MCLRACVSIYEIQSRDQTVPAETEESLLYKSLLRVFKQRTYSLFLQVNRYRIWINNTDTHVYAVSIMRDEQGDVFMTIFGSG